MVIGARRESRQDLMSLVGIGSSGQVEFEDERMTRRTSCDAGDRLRSGVEETAAVGIGHELELMQEKGELSKAWLFCH